MIVPKRKAKKEALMRHNKSKVSSTSTQNGNQNELLAQHQTLAAVVINGVMQVSTYVMDDEILFRRDNASDRTRMPHIGTHETRNTSAVSTRSRPTYDHHVNVFHE